MLKYKITTLEELAWRLQWLTAKPRVDFVYTKRNIFVAAELGYTFLFAYLLVLNVNKIKHQILAKYTNTYPPNKEHNHIAFL